ncbi:MAG: hypothetical protein FJ090_17625, partial [Deltaproteobacteria bacterium]|nr:hypothetical protein [Deltaproteobacteria bacterium]
MSDAERRVPGEQLAERMQRRTFRRPSLGMSPSFYGRLGIDDPWAVEGADLAPSAAAGDMVFLSAAPYYAMMRKLAAARRRRERRMQRFLEKRVGSTLRAGSITTPSVGLPGAPYLPSRRLSALSIADMTLPPAAPAPAPAEPAALVAATDGRGERPSSWRPATKVAHPWL